MAMIGSHLCNARVYHEIACNVKNNKFSVPKFNIAQVGSYYIYIAGSLCSVCVTVCILRFIFLLALLASGGHIKLVL